MNLCLFILGFYVGFGLLNAGALSFNMVSDSNRWYFVHGLLKWPLMLWPWSNYFDDVWKEYKRTRGRE